MGVDVQLYVEISEPSPETMAKANEIFDSLCDLGDWSERPSLEFHKGWGRKDTLDYAADRVEVNTLCRYYSGGSYRAYNWPRIYDGIKALQKIFPGYTICYGGDSLFYSEPLTDERLEELNNDYMKYKEE